MLEHKCKECGEVWCDRENDTSCPNGCSGGYTTEPVEVNYDEMERYLQGSPDKDEA